MYGLGMAKGMVVTFKNMVLPKRMFTLHQYPNRKVGPFGLAKHTGSGIFNLAVNDPVQFAKSLIGLVSIEDRYPQHPRFRGEEFTWYEDRCTGCASCAKYCPLGIIEIVTDPSGSAIQEGEKYALEVFDIDIGRCMFCGLCVEACPYDALHMGSGFEEGTYKRGELVIDKTRLNESPKNPSNWFRPQLEDRGNDPRDGSNVDWNDAGRHEKPSLSQQEERWSKR